MTDRPIIFSAPMIRALLDGSKTQTRRIIKRGLDLQVNGNWHCHGKGGGSYDCDEREVREAMPDYLPISVGDLLWVRETWSAIMTGGWTIADARTGLFQNETVYRADGHGFEHGDGWWPSIHMPREFSRLTLIVTDVRVQRAQDISRGDAMAEGCPFANMADGPNPRDWYADLWDTLHGPGAWDANPWVMAIGFIVRHGNIDDLGGAP